MSLMKKLQKNVTESGPDRQRLPEVPLSFNGKTEFDRIPVTVSVLESIGLLPSNRRLPHRWSKLRHSSGSFAKSTLAIMQQAKLDHRVTLSRKFLQSNRQSNKKCLAFGLFEIEVAMIVILPPGRVYPWVKIFFEHGSVDS